MKAKLIKVDNIYRLLKEDDFHEFKLIIGTTDEEYQKAFSDHCYPLSLKNCEAIERGYDLDEIKRKLFNCFDGQPDSFTIAAVEKTTEIMFEILGDKKFSEDDVLKIVDFTLKDARKAVVWSETYHEFVAKDAIQSLQQTEWDVEIVEQCLDPTCDGVNRKGECITTGEPKLDADGQLILKRV